MLSKICSEAIGKKRLYKHGLFCCFSIICCCIFLLSCDSQKKDWEEASSAATVESFENFLKLHPKGKYTEDASSQIQKIMFAHATSANTIAEYQHYLMRFPQGSFAGAAKERMDVLKYFPLKEIGYENLMSVEDKITLWCDNDSIRVKKYKAIRNTFISWDDMILVFNWDQTASIFHPKGSENKFAGIRITGDGERETFGNMCAGNILLSGPAILKDKGVLLQKGSYIIHPDKYALQDDIAALDYRASLLEDKDRKQEAEELWRRSLNLTEKKYGPRHTSVAITLNNLAINLCYQKKYDESEKLYKRAIEIEENKFGRSSPKLATTIKNFAYLLEKKGNKSESKVWYKRAEQLKQK
jgi:tetratricopeptide (TPR) repeat protein